MRYILFILSCFFLVSIVRAESDVMYRPYVFYPNEGKHDRSFGQAAYKGVVSFRKDFNRLKAFYGYKGVLDDRGLDGSSVSNNLSMAVKQVEQAAVAGYNPIVIIGLMAPLTLDQVASRYPKTTFVAVDSPASSKIPNAVSFTFSASEGAYLAGYLAAMLSRTHRVAALGGMAMRPVKRYICGFQRGVEGYSAKQKAAGKPEVRFIGPVYVGTTLQAFMNVSQAKALANNLYSQGVDVIFAVAGLASLSVLEASKESSMADKKFYSIGVDSNQNYVAPGHVITSVVKRVEEPLYASLLLGMLGSLDQLHGRSILLGIRGMSLRGLVKRQPAFVRRYLGRMAVDIVYDKYNRHLIGSHKMRSVITHLKRSMSRGSLKIAPCSY